MLIALTDRFLPFSLLHNRDDQYCFSVDHPPTSPGLPSGPPSNPGGSDAATDPGSIPGLHEQAIFDATCQAMTLSSPAQRTGGGDMNSHDPTPLYDMNLVLRLLRVYLENEEYDFWASVAHENQLRVAVTSVDALRMELIHHIFSGTCVSNDAPGCKAVVSLERWPQSMGIRVIDSTLEWVDQGTLSTTSFEQVCKGLGIETKTVNKKRALTKMLVNRRWDLLNAVDAESLSLDCLVPQLGCSSSMKVVRSIGVSHGIDMSDGTTRDKGAEMIFDHITQGKCAANAKAAPGCERVVRDVPLKHRDVVHLQVAALQSIIKVASKKQLLKILDLHEIDCKPNKTHKGLRFRLTRYVEKITKCKLKEAEAESDAIERLR